MFTRRPITYRLIFVIGLLMLTGCQAAKKPGAFATSHKAMSAVVADLVQVGMPIEEAVEIMEAAGFSSRCVTAEQGSGSKRDAPPNLLDPNTIAVTCHREKIRTGLFPGQWEVTLEVDDRKVSKISTSILETGF